MQPEKLGPFRIGRVIGRGGMGAVYEGVHEETGESAAVKVLLSTLEDDNELRLRFEAEIDTLKRLRHPNIVRLFGFGEEQGMLYYVMELVDGPSLHQEIKRQRLFQWHEAAKIGLDMCQALKHGHDRGITHRDIKPANILLDQRGLAKLSDYGIAHFFGGQRLTEINSVVGTLEYMSPEQSLANPVGPRSDLYSLGTVLYVLLVGKPPFAAKSLAEIARKHQRNIIESIRSVRLDVPDELEAIILDLLKIKPEERPSNAYLTAKRFQSLMQALVGPPERILVKPMTPDSPTTLPLEPARIPYRGDEEPEEKIGAPRGLVIENGVIDLGGIVDNDQTSALDPPIAEPGVFETTISREPPSDSLADSFGRPGGNLNHGEQTIGMSSSPIFPAPTIQCPGLAAPVSIDDLPGDTVMLPDMHPGDVNPARDADDVSGTSPTWQTREVTRGRSLSGKPNSESTVASHRIVEPPKIRHGEMYRDDSPSIRPGKDEPIPEYNVFKGIRAEPEVEEPEPPEVHGKPPLPDDLRIASGTPLVSEPVSASNDELTIDGIGTEHRPVRPNDPSAASPEPSSVEPYGLQKPALATKVASQDVGRTMSDRSGTTSKFVSVVDQEFDDFGDQDGARRPIVSLQTVFASCCLIITGLVAFYLLQPVPPDIQYERIVRPIESAADNDDYTKALRRAEKDINDFLSEHLYYPKADQLRNYLQDLDLDKLEREIERKLQTMDSKAIPPVQRAYMEAMASVKTDPERTVIKLQALIDLFQSDTNPGGSKESEVEGAETDAANPTKPARQRSFRGARGTRDEDFVFLAARQLERLEQDIDKINSEQVEKLRLRLQHAKEIEAENPDRADTIRAAVIELYRDKHWAEEIVSEAREGLEH